MSRPFVNSEYVFDLDEVAIIYPLTFTRTAGVSCQHCFNVKLKCGVLIEFNCENPQPFPDDIQQQLDRANLGTSSAQRSFVERIHNQTFEVNKKQLEEQRKEFILKVFPDIDPNLI